MKPTYEELEAEVERLRSKLSPLEDKELTSVIRPLLTSKNLADFRVGPRYIVKSKDLWAILFGVAGNQHETASLGRSLQALGWVRSARQGERMFTMTAQEFDDVQESQA